MLTTTSRKGIEDLWKNTENFVERYFRIDVSKTVLEVHAGRSPKMI
jgi:hypothetical protein